MILAPLVQKLWDQNSLGHSKNRDFAQFLDMSKNAKLKQTKIFGIRFQHVGADRENGFEYKGKKYCHGQFSKVVV